MLELTAKKSNSANNHYDIAFYIMLYITSLLLIYLEINILYLSIVLASYLSTPF